jgi:N-methylhydantoinase B
MICASGGGFGDPLDRDPLAVQRDLDEQRVDPDAARDIYGVAFTDGRVDLAATEARRGELRGDRLTRAAPPAVAATATIGGEPPVPLYPGVVQRGNLAVSEWSGAVLAVAPGNWLDGCPVLDLPIDERAGGTVARAHLDPASGRILYVDVIRRSDGPSIDIRPDRWTRAGHNLPKQGAAA